MLHQAQVVGDLLLDALDVLIVHNGEVYRDVPSTDDSQNDLPALLTAAGKGLQLEYLRPLGQTG